MILLTRRTQVASNTAGRTRVARTVSRPSTKLSSIGAMTISARGMRVMHRVALRTAVAHPPETLSATVGQRPQHTTMLTRDRISITGQVRASITRTQLT